MDIVVAHLSPRRAALAAAALVAIATSTPAHAEEVPGWRFGLEVNAGITEAPTTGPTLGLGVALERPLGDRLAAWGRFGGSFRAASPDRGSDRGSLFDLLGGGRLRLGLVELSLGAGGCFYTSHYEPDREAGGLVAHSHQTLFVVAESSLRVGGPSLGLALRGGYGVAVAGDDGTEGGGDRDSLAVVRLVFDVRFDL